MKIIFLGHKPPLSALPVEDEDDKEEQIQQQQPLDIMNTSADTDTKNTNTFCLGTLRAQKIVDTTPPTNNTKGWSDQNNPTNNKTSGFYGGESSGISSSSSDSDSDSSNSNGDSDSSISSGK